MSRQLRVGLLVVGGLFLFLLGLFALANRTFLLSDTFVISSEFTRVAGLRSGAEVQYQGINVGRVERVRLPLRPGDKIVVTMALKGEVRPLIRQNTQAQIKSDGLVGDQIVVLVSPPNSADVPPISEEGATIPGVDPFDLFEITDKALVSVQRFEQAAMTLDTIMNDVRSGQGTIGKIIYDPSLYETAVATVGETQRVLGSLADNAQAVVGLAEDATTSLQSIINKIDSGEGSLALMLNDPGVYNALLATSDTLLNIAGDLRAITTGAEHMTNWGALGAFRFAELMEAAKHNWLFKRYFEERGYMEQAPFEVRERALEETYKGLAERERSLYEWEERLKLLVARLEAAGIEVPPPPANPPDTPRNNDN